MDARANFWAVANALAVGHVGIALASSASSARRLCYLSRRPACRPREDRSRAARSRKYFFPTRTMTRRRLLRRPRRRM